MERIEKTISELENSKVKITQSEQKREIDKKKKASGTGNIIRLKICVISVPKGEERKVGLKNCTKK